MYFHQGLKNFDIQKNDISSLKKSLSKIEIFCLFVYGSIVGKWIILIHLKRF
jgi:hypothetical protein